MFIATDYVLYGMFHCAACTVVQIVIITWKMYSIVVVGGDLHYIQCTVVFSGAMDRKWIFVMYRSASISYLRKPILEPAVTKEKGNKPLKVKTFFVFFTFEYSTIYRT